MGIIKKMWNAMHTSYLGGDVHNTVGTVRGKPGMATIADLSKASGEVRVHHIQTRREEHLVTLEFLQEKTMGDSTEMACVQLAPADAQRLGALLEEAAQLARVPAPAVSDLQE